MKTFAVRTQLLEALDRAQQSSARMHLMHLWFAGAILQRLTCVNNHKVLPLYFKINAKCGKWAHKEGAD